MTRLLFVKLWRDLRAARGRMVLISIAISMSLIAFSAVVYTRAIVDPQISLNYLGTNPASARIVFDAPVKPDQVDAVLRAARAEPGVIDATLRTVNDFQMQTPDGRLSSIPLQLFTASPSDPMHMARFPVVQGSWPPPAGSVLIERESLDFLNLKVGDHVTVVGLDGRPVSLVISGMVHDPSLAPSYEEQRGHGYISTATLPLLGMQPALDQLAITVADQPGGTVPSHNRETIVRTSLHLADRLKQTMGMGIEEVQVPQPYQHPHQGQMDTMLTALLLFGSLSLLLSSILIATMFNGFITQQIPQIGMLKAVGARRSQILLLYLFMVLLLAAVAIAVAFIPGIVLARAASMMLLVGMLNMDPTSLAAPWWAYALVIVTGLALPGLLALFPLVRASRITVRQALDERGVGKPGTMARRLDSLLARLRGLDRRWLLAFRNTFRRRARFVLSVGLLATAGALFISGLNVGTSIGAIPGTLSAEHRWDVDMKLDTPASVSQMQSLLARIPHVTQAEAWNTVSTGIQSAGQINVTGTYPDQGHGSSSVTAIPAGSKLFVPPLLLEGRWLRPDDTDAIVLPPTMRGKMQGSVGSATVQFAVGGRLTRWHVVGIVQEYFAPTCPCVSRAGFDQVTGLAHQADRFVIVTDRHDLQTRMAVAQGLSQALAGAGIKMQYVRPLDWLTGVSVGHLYILVTVFLLLASVMGIVGLIGLGSTMSTNVIERTREFGVMSVIGATGPSVRRIVVGEGVFTAVSSCLVAIVAALLLTQLIDRGFGNLQFGTPLLFLFSAPALLSWVVAIVLGAVLATLAAAFRASRLTVREALAYL